MSSSVKDRPTDNSGGGDDGGGECSRGKDRNLCNTHDRKPKRVSLFRFRSSGKRQSSGRSNRPSPALPGRGGGGSRGGGVVGGGGGRLCLCFKPTPTLDSPPGESQTSDPNNSELKFEFLKRLIEKNDFWSKECNTHLDLESISSCSDDDDNCVDNLRTIK